MEELVKLYEAFSNPVAAALALSVLLEQLDFIKDKTVANWKKLAAVAATGVVWQFAVILFGLTIGKTTFEFTVGSVFAAVLSGLTMASGMAVFNYVVNLLPPAVRDFILALFGRNVITVTATTVTGTEGAVSSVSTVPATSSEANSEIIGALG